MLPVSSADADIYDRLMTVIETSQGRLAILIAVCNERSLRERIIQSYEEEARQAQIAPYRIELSRGGSIRGKLLELRQAHTYLQEGGEAVVTVTGAELLPGYNLTAEDLQKTPLEEFFGYLQWTREGMREFPFPVVLWLNHRLMKEISFKAPDFWSWRKGVFWFAEETSTDLPTKTFDNQISVVGNKNDRDIPVFNDDKTPSLVRVYSWLKDKATDIFLSSSIRNTSQVMMELQETIAELEATDPNSPNLANLYERLGDN